jgi:hypothetical protein
MNSQEKYTEKESFIMLLVIVTLVICITAVTLTTILFVVDKI